MPRSKTDLLTHLLSDRQAAGRHTGKQTDRLTDRPTAKLGIRSEYRREYAQREECEPVNMQVANLADLLTNAETNRNTETVFPNLKLHV